VLAQGQSVGLDIQQLDTEVRVQALADRYFSANEARTLSGMPDADKKTAFFTHWVLKESLAKQQGRGLMHGALRTGFIPQPDSEAACHWFFRWEGLFCAVSFEAGIAWSRMDCHVLEQQKMRRVVWDVEQQDGVKASHCVAQSFDKFLAT
jgi:phosphopantetheinyl transferase